MTDYGQSPQKDSDGHDNDKRQETAKPNTTTTTATTRYNYISNSLTTPRFTYFFPLYLGSLAGSGSGEVALGARSGCRSCSRGAFDCKSFELFCGVRVEVLLARIILAIHMEELAKVDLIFARQGEGTVGIVQV